MRNVAEGASRRGITITFPHPELGTKKLPLYQDGFRSSMESLEDPNIGSRTSKPIPNGLREPVLELLDATEVLGGVNVIRRVLDTPSPQRCRSVVTRHAVSPMSDHCEDLKDDKPSLRDDWEKTLVLEGFQELL